MGAYMVLCRAAAAYTGKEMSIRQNYEKCEKSTNFTRKNSKKIVK